MNFSELNQKLNRLLNNIKELLDNYFEVFLDPTPANVSIDWYDLDGNLTTTTVPNLAKIRQDLENSFLTYFQPRVYYVDPSVGSDSNPGTETQPFASIQKAIYQTPTSGWVEIRLKSDYNISGIITIDRKNVIIVGYGGQKALNPRYSSLGGGAYTGFIKISSGVLKLDNISTTLPPIFRTSEVISSQSRGLISVLEDSTVIVTNSSINLNGASNTYNDSALVQGLIFCERAGVFLTLRNSNVESFKVASDNSSNVIVPALITHRSGERPPIIRVQEFGTSLSSDEPTVYITRVLVDGRSQIRYVVNSSESKSVLLNVVSNVIVLSNRYNTASDGEGIYPPPSTLT